jgi:hypothetical protein
VGLIKNLKIYVHDILYITIFYYTSNSVVDFSYSMLLGKPWLRDAKWHMIGGITLLSYKGMGQL